MNFTPLPLYPMKDWKIPGTYKPGVWVGPWAGADILEKRKTSCLCWDKNPWLANLYWLDHLRIFNSKAMDPSISFWNNKYAHNSDSSQFPCRRTKHFFVPPSSGSLKGYSIPETVMFSQIARTCQRKAKVVRHHHCQQNKIYSILFIYGLFNYAI
jgi:hypothetical protein